MNATITERHGNDYEGHVKGKPFRVQIGEASSPHWYDSNLDGDDRAGVLNAIDQASEKRKAMTTIRSYFWNGSNWEWDGCAWDSDEFDTNGNFTAYGDRERIRLVSDDGQEQAGIVVDGVFVADYAD